MARSRVPNAPTKPVWLVAIIVGGIGVVAHFVDIPELSQYNYWLLLIGFLLLVLGTSTKNI